MQRNRRKKHFSKRFFWITVGVCAVLLTFLAGSAYLLISEKPIAEPNVEEFNPYHRIAEQYSPPDRSTYGYMSNVSCQASCEDCEPPSLDTCSRLGPPVSDAFKKLPPIPEHYGAFVKTIMERGVKTYCDIPREYYLQPEFISNIPPWTLSGLHYWTSPDPTHVTDYGGKSAWPLYQRIDVYPKLGGVVSGRVCAYFFPGWSVWKYVGAKAVPMMLSQGAPLHLDGGCSVVNSTSVVPKGLSVAITPDDFLIGPNFPSFSVEQGGDLADWVRKVEVYVNVSSDVLPGTYVVGVDLAPPSESFSDYWHLKVLDENSMYTTPRVDGLVFNNVVCGVNVPPFQLEVVVH